MARRFTDTDIWKKKWFRKLNCTQKCFVKYLFDACNQAGIWEVDFEAAEFYIGEKVGNPKDFLPDDFTIIDMNGGEKWFLPKFLIFQYPSGLNSQKPAIVSVRNILVKYDLVTIVQELFGNDYLMINESLTNDSIMIDKSLKTNTKTKIKTNTKTNTNGKNNSVKEIQNFWLKKHPNGKNYVVTNYPKWGGQVKNLLNAFKPIYNDRSLDEIKNRITKFCTSNNKFIRESGYSFDVFLTTINQLTRGDPNATDQGHNPGGSYPEPDVVITEEDR